jgi:hypothetical protein
MKFTTIALTVALTVPSSFALARGGMHGGGMHIGKSRHSGLREPRRYRPRRKQTQECYGKYARSHRA